MSAAPQEIMHSYLDKALQHFVELLSPVRRSSTVSAHSTSSMLKVSHCFAFFCILYFKPTQYVEANWGSSPKGTATPFVVGLYSIECTIHQCSAVWECLSTAHGDSPNHICCVVVDVLQDWASLLQHLLWHASS